MTVYDVVKKLLGGIEPIGDSSVDEKKFKNLQDTIVLVDQLIIDIQDVARLHTDYRHSLNKAGKEARSFLSNLTNLVEEIEE